MTTDYKVTELFCIIDEFCKYFDAENAGNLLETIVKGSVEHPMIPEHYIEWIELLTPTDVLRHELKPSEKPEAIFMTDATEVTAREYCNLHGLWKGK